jgi:hypothetical protein
MTLITVTYDEVSDMLKKALKNKYVGKIHDERLVIDVEIDLQQICCDYQYSMVDYFDALEVYFIVETKTKKTQKKIRVYLN